MTTRLCTWLATTAVIAATSLAGVQDKATPKPAPKPTTAAIDQKAPDFTLTDISGKQHTLKDYAGNIVVLEWFNCGCPYSGRPSDFAVNSGKTQALRKNLADAAPGTVYLLIDSSANRSKETLIKENVAAAESLKIDAPILIDHDGAVGRAYKARTTPHMYVIDAEGVLRYQGAFDDDRKNAKGDKATNHVLEAVKAVNAGKSPKPSKTRSWGCSVKYE